MKTEEIAQRTTAWIKDYAEVANRDSLIIGLSGGIDSAVVARLCENTGMQTICVSMEARPSASTLRSREFCKKTGTNVEFIETSIASVLSSFCSLTGRSLCAEDKLRYGNLSARIRANVLYDIATERNGLVVGTCNLDELAIGYFTKGGDGLCDIEPIGELHKSEIKDLAKYLDIPKFIIEATPSAELWDGQTDEDELEMTYDEIEWAIEFDDCGGLITENSLSDRQKETLHKVREMRGNTSHKRNPPPICKQI